MDTHAVIARNFIDLIRFSTEFQVDYYFSQKILKQLNVEKSAAIFQVDSKNLFKKISENNTKNGQYDLIIIGTAHRYFNTFLKISQHFNTAIVVHNLNFVQLSSFQLILNIFKKESIFRTKLLLNEGLLAKNKLYKTTKNVLVLDENLVKNNLRFLPLFYANEIEGKTTENLSIVIPGGVSQERRDYKSVLSKIENWSKNSSNSELEIVFLGKAENPELQWLRDFESKKLQNVKLVYFEEKVPQNVFGSYMKNATYLWCPLQISTSFFSNEEIYGISKMSGIIADVINYKKIAVLPKAYPSNFTFIKADTEDLESQIRLFSNQNFQYDFDAFSKEKVLGKLEKVLENLIKKIIPQSNSAK